MGLNVEKFKLTLGKGVNTTLPEGIIGPVCASPSIEESVVDELIAQSRKERFTKKYSAKVMRGETSIFVGGDEWKAFKIAELFDYSPEILDILEGNIEEVLNQTPTIQLVLGLEQVRLLRAVKELLEKDYAR